MRRTLLLLALLVPALALVLYAVLGGASGAGGSTDAVVLENDGTLAPRSTESVARPEPRETIRDGVLDAPPEEPQGEAYDTELEVFLDLVRPAGALHAEGEQALGSGANASLLGGLWEHSREGVQGTVTFVSGANAGRVLACDQGGRFGANDLYPGISVVDVTGPGIPGSLREVVLRNGRETRLNIGYGRLATVNGEVVDPRGEPVQGATVRMDGIPIETDEWGRFTLQGVAGSHGDMVVTVEKDGLVPIRTTTSVTSGTTVPYGKHRYVLRESGSLEVYIAEKIGAAGSAQLYLMPSTPMMQQTDFAWHRRNPIAVQPGSTTMIEGLPPGEVRALLFHAGAVSKPGIATARVRAGTATPVTFHLEPAPMLAGKVTRDGSPVARAIVRVEAPDRTAAMLRYLGEPAGYLETQVFPNLPPGVATVKTDDLGNFRVGLFGDPNRMRYLTATSFDGKGWAGKVLRPGEHEVQLELGAAREGAEKLLIEISERGLMLDVDVRVDGAPRGMRRLRPDQQLEIDGLMEGDWELSVRWGRDWLFLEQPLIVQDGAAFYVSLPPLSETGADD